MEYKISIIVPVYQSEQYIRECLLSLVKQNISGIEIICVDDGSNDQSANIIKELQEKYKNIIYIFQENRGVSAARNHGLKVAHGKYIMFVDADDSIRRNSLKFLYDRAEREKAEMLIFRGMVKAKCKAPEWMRMAFYSRNSICSKVSVDILLQEPGALPSVCNKVFLREYLQGYSFDEDIHIAEDQLFLWRIFPGIKKVVFLKKIIYRYRTDNESSAMHRTQKNVCEKMQDHLVVAERIIEACGNFIMLGNKDKFSEWITAFLREPYKALSGESKDRYVLRIENIYKSINSNNLLEIPEARYEGSGGFKRVFHILIRDIKKYGVYGGIENLIYKLLYRK